jgi:DNA-binding protein H-NS
MSYPNVMDHLAMLREKIGSLRAEIADLQDLNDQYRRQGHHEAEAQLAHRERQERLRAIQQELSQLADLSRRVLSFEQRKAEHRARLHVGEKAS